MKRNGQPCRKPTIRTPHRVVLFGAILATICAAFYLNSSEFNRWLTQYQYQRQANRFLDIPVASLNLDQAFDDDILAVLSQSYHVPVSLIEGTPGMRTSNIHVRNGTVRTVLDQMVTCNRSYTWRNVMGRLVFLPHLPMYDWADRFAGIVHKPRFEATCSYYGGHLKSLQGFPEVRLLSVPMPTTNNPTNHPANDPVTVTPDGTLIEHLVQLLGSDPSITFRISRSCFAINQVDLPPHPSSIFTRLLAELNLGS